VIAKHPFKRQWVTGDAAGKLKVTQDDKSQ